jgi:hypothetical protein
MGSDERWTSTIQSTKGLCLFVIWCSLYCDWERGFVEWNIWFCGIGKKAGLQLSGTKYNLWWFRWGISVFLSFQVSTKCLGLLCYALWRQTSSTQPRQLTYVQIHVKCWLWVQISQASEGSEATDHFVTLKYQHHAENLHIAASVAILVQLPAERKNNFSSVLPSVPAADMAFHKNNCERVFVPMVSCLQQRDRFIFVLYFSILLVSALLHLLQRSEGMNTSWGGGGRFILYRVCFRTE